MAVSAPTLVGNFYDTDNTGTYNSNDTVNSSGNFTFAMVSGRRYYVLIHSFSSGAAELVSSVTFDPGGADASSFTVVTDGTNTAEQSGGMGNTGDTFQLWYFDATANTGTSFLRVIFGGTQSAAGFGVFYVTGHRHGDTGATAHPQVSVVSNTNASPATTFGTALGTGSLTLLCVGINNTTGTVTATEGRTELYENDETERNNHALHYEVSGTDTTIGATLNVSQAWTVFGVEVAAAEGASSDDVLIRLGSMGTTDGSGLVTADFTAGAAATVFGGAYLLRRRLLDAMTGLDDV